MTEPLTALVVLAVLALLAGILFWPGWGLFWRGLRNLRATGRVLVEDALKHLFDCEYRKQVCTLQSLSGALGLGGNRTARLLGRLERLRLVTSEAAGYRLTPEGRRYALRVVRIHRLWERYFSESTGLGALEWHARAETREHRTSAEQAESLAASMGYPRYDPHGDPIPTASGEIVPPRGRPLTDLAPGSVGQIVHVEDEPHAVYARLLAERLHPGMTVHVRESTPEAIRFEADGREHVIEPVIAANLWAVEQPEAAAPPAGFERLSVLELGQRATVVGISSACRTTERRRMLDLGFVPGSTIVAEMRSPGGDPTAYRVRGALIALRREQAELVHIQRVAEEVPA